MIDVIRQRLAAYDTSNSLLEEQALKEILQECALYGLWRAGFFEVAAFQGGTSLRILHRLPRFSEDLDFILKDTNPGFDWGPYLQGLRNCLLEFGVHCEVSDKGRMDQRIRKALLKDNSIANQLELAFYRGRPQQKLRIKLEIDVNPPASSGYAYSYLDFPLDFEVCHQDLPSNFALKIHALLCRPYLKGRDWFDFNWYVKQGVSSNLDHLSAALNQYGPWQGLKPDVDREWLQRELQTRIDDIHWEQAVQDVERFLAATELVSLSLWSRDFFTTKLQQL